MVLGPLAAPRPLNFFNQNTGYIGKNQTSIQNGGPEKTGAAKAMAPANFGLPVLGLDHGRPV